MSLDRGENIENVRHFKREVGNDILSNTPEKNARQNLRITE